MSEDCTHQGVAHPAVLDCPQEVSYKQSIRYRVKAVRSRDFIKHLRGMVSLLAVMYRMKTICSKYCPTHVLLIAHKRSAFVKEFSTGHRLCVVGA